MTKNQRIRVLFLSLCSLAACSGATQAGISQLDEIPKAYATNNRFMGTVLVAQGDRVILDRGYGEADVERQTPNTPDTKFRLGSLTKQFTAACILLLEERGKLRTDDLVKKYMPDAPAAWDKVTIFHLLTHTSGIPSFTEFPDYRAHESTSMSPEKLVAWFRDRPLEFAPGTQWKYSNSGYVLLGYLIEKITGQSYADFLRQNIFKPLGMNDSGYDSNSAVIPHRASGYTRHGDIIETAGYIDMSIPFSAGALYSTTHDLLRWEQGLFGGKVVSSASLKKMTTPFKNNYAMGLRVVTRGGHRQIAHSGGIEGFNTSMMYWPEDKLTVIVLANLNPPVADQIAGKIGALLVYGIRTPLPK